MKTLQDIAESEAAKKAYSLWDEFRNFAFKGNVVDLAVGVVIGTAFGAIINSLVKHIIMPLVAVVVPGNQGYKGWTFTLNGQVIPYGEFLAEVVNFLLLAAVLFFVIVKFLGWVVRTKKQEQAAAPPSKQELLLTEIRDLLARTVPVAPSATPTTSSLTPDGRQ